jgi:processive 1,2-diacylglycerol beta-glucosyltransferase
VPGAPRILLLTASVGEGHDLPARVLADALEPAAEPVVVDVLPLLGRLVAGAAEGGMRETFGVGRMNWLFDLEYLLFSRLWPTRRLGQRLLYLLTAPRLREAVQGYDAVVTTYPIASEVLGRLRANGLLGIPVCSAITDLAGLHYWAQRGIDLHLVTHPESIEEVERIAGAGSARAVCGLTRPGFLSPPSQGEARRRLGIPKEASVVSVSGGGWGVGDLDGAVRTALALPGVTVLCLCGRNDALRSRLEAVFDEWVRVLGFVDDMPTLLAATDVLVHSTAGLTVLEAHMLGCRVISYGWGIGHIRLNNRAFARYRIAEVASSPRELGAAIERGLHAPRTPRVEEFAELPAAAELVLELAGSPQLSRTTA